jgi:hypothetical protein
MKSWNANVLVCDDLWYSIAGKINLFGIYTGDIVIAADTQLVAQLIFFFTVEGDLSEPPTKALTLEVALPNDPPRTMVIQSPVLGDGKASGRTRWFSRTPFVLPQIQLRPGRIRARVLYGTEEITLSAPWVTRWVAPPTAANAS